jgi:hypothetical protein
VIAVVFHDEFVREGIRDGHLRRHVGDKVAVKNPITGRRSPIGGHGSAAKQGIGDNGALLSVGKNVIAFSISCAVHAEV